MHISEANHTNDEIVKKLMEGSIEFHVHFAPEGKVKRKNDAFELVRDAKNAGMRAVVLKNKCLGTGALAQLANKYADGTLAIGGVTLDVSMGGFNPEAVEIEVALGSKMVWMPTYSALNDPKNKKNEKDKRRNILSPIDQEGNLLPEVLEILDIIKKENMVLGTGHISRDEIFALVIVAVDMGVEKIVINHPLTKSVGTRLSLQDQIALTEMGAYIDHCWVATQPKHDQLPHSDYLEAIRAVGVEKCIVSTDYGQVHNATPIEGFYMMLDGLLEQGFSSDELNLMIKDNPAYLLDI